MAELIGQRQQAVFTNPQDGQTAFASGVVANDNAVRSTYNGHDADPTIHFQSGLTGERPGAGSLGAKFLDRTTKRVYFDDGSNWQEIGYALASHTHPASEITAGTFGTGNYVFPGNLTFTGGQAAPKRHDKGDQSGAVTINFNDGNRQRLRLIGNITGITFQNMIAGAEYVLELVQDGTGSRTVAWGTAVKWGGGSTPTLTPTANRKDVVTLYCVDGSTPVFLGALFGTNFADTT